jgi:hypothetical protein
VEVGLRRHGWAESGRCGIPEKPPRPLSAIQLVTTPEEFGAFMKAELEKWGSLLKQAPIKLD